MGVTVVNLLWQSGSSRNSTRVTAAAIVAHVCDVTALFTSKANLDIGVASEKQSPEKQRLASAARSTPEDYPIRERAAR